MEVPKGWNQCKQAGVLLAGLVLICALQLGEAEKRVSVTMEPQHPQEGQNVTLSVRGGPSQFTHCEWYREAHKGGSELFLEYTPDQKRNDTSRGQRETVRSDCSLHISKLRPSDTGNYSVSIEVSSAKQQPGQRPTQQPGEVYEGSVYLQVAALHQRPITIALVPQQPRQGQEVTMNLQVSPQKFVSCEWFKLDSYGHMQSINKYTPSEPQSPQGTDLGKQERLYVQRDCSLRVTKLTTSDAGTYVVKMQVASDPQKEQPGQGTQSQGPLQEYKGQVELKVYQDAEKDPQKGNSAGLKYSTGVIVGALIGFFVWTDTVTSLFHGLSYRRP